MSGVVAGAVAGVVGAVACGAGGLAVRPLVGRLPQPEGDGTGGPSYAAVAAEPGLTARAVGCSALAGAVLGAALGWSWALLLLWPLVPLGSALALVDLRTRLLPRRLVWAALAAALVLGSLAGALAGEPAAVLRAAAAGASAFAVFFSLWWVYPPGLGFGDVRLSAVIGVALGWLGWVPVLVGFYAAFLGFAVPGLLVALVRRERRVLATAYPFGPFLLGGAVLGAVAGEPLWRHLVGG